MISRFVDRSWQLVGDQERAHYLARLSQALSRSDWVLIGYALMSSHVHLLLVAGEDPLGSWTKSVHVRMARWLNTRHGRLGPVFAERPYAEAIDDGRTAYVLAYLHNNPVRARLVGAAAQSTWTSHRAYLGLAPASGGLSIAAGLQRCGFRDDAEGLDAFDQWVNACAMARDAVATPQQLHQARASARLTAGAHIELGTPTQSANGLYVPVVLPRSTRWHARNLTITPGDVLHAVVDATGFDARGRSHNDRRPPITQARRLALALWSRTHQPRSLMARALGIGAAAASDLVHRYEGKVDDLCVEEIYAQLEALCAREP